MPRKKRCASPFELMDDDFDDNSSQSSRNGNPPVQRNAANARERARMRVLSSAFGRLKTKLPNIPADTKLSKLDTLRLATMYIKQLKSVVEGGSVSPRAHDESLEMTFNNNNSTNCYINLNTAAQNMNWPFGFHHHLSHTPLIRSTSLNTFLNSNSSNGNWCSRDNTEEQMKQHASYVTENCNNHQPQSISSTLMNKGFLNHENNNHQHNHWFSETPSPELDTMSSNTCLSFENSHSQQHQQQSLNSNHHHLPHLQPPASIHSSTFHLPPDDFQHHHHQTQQNLPSVSHHLHQNGFVNSSNFQSTSIR